MIHRAEKYAQNNQGKGSPQRMPEEIREARSLRQSAGLVSLIGVAKVAINASLASVQLKADPSPRSAEGRAPRVRMTIRDPAFQEGHDLGDRSGLFFDEGFPVGGFVGRDHLFR